MRLAPKGVVRLFGGARRSTFDRPLVGRDLASGQCQVGLTIGQQATAGSATTAVDVIDPTGHGVTLSVDVTKFPQVKVGQKASVMPDGSTTPLAATVTYLADAPTTSGSTAYDVELALAANPVNLLTESNRPSRSPPRRRPTPSRSRPRRSSTAEPAPMCWS